MASRREELKIDVIATDDASKVLSDVTDKVERLEGETAEVTIDADDKASSEIAQLRQRLNSLTAEEYQAVLTAEARKLDAEVRRANQLLTKLDGEEAQPVIDARDQASAKAQAIREELDKVDKIIADPTVDLTDHASGDARRIRDLLDDLDNNTYDPTLDVQTGSGFDKVTGAISAMPGQIGAAGTVMSGLTTRGGAATVLAGLLAAAAGSAADTAVEVDNLATFAGISTEEASRLYAVFQDNNVEATDLMDIIGQMSGVLADNPQLVTDMGISMDTVRQGPVATLIAVMDKFWSDGKLSDEERIVAMQLFGEEGVRQVTNIASAVKGDLRGAMDEVAEGRIFDEDEIARAREFNRDMQEAMGALKSIVMDIGGPVLDVASPILDVLAKVAELIPKAWDVLTLDGGTLREADFSQQFKDFLALLQTGVDQAEAWNTAYGSMDGFDIFQSQIEDAIGMIERGVPITEAMGEVFGASEDNAVALATALGIVDAATGDVADGQDNAADATDDATEAIDEQRDALEEEADQLEENIELLEEYIDAQRDAYDAGVDFREATQDTTEALEKYNEVAQDTEATEVDRREAGERVIDAMVDEADAAVELARANAKARGETLSATQAANVQISTYSRLASQIPSELIPQYVNMLMAILDIPEERRTEVTAAVASGDVAEIERVLSNASRTRKAAIQVDANQASLKNTENKLNWLTRPRSVWVDLTGPGARGTGAGGAPGRAPGVPLPEATGISFAPEGTYLVGEQGPEILKLPRGSKIIPNHRLDTFGEVKSAVRRGVVLPRTSQRVREAEAAKRAAAKVAAQPAPEPEQTMTGGGGVRSTFAERRREATAVPVNNTTNITINAPAGTTPERVINATRRYLRIQGTTL